MIPVEKFNYHDFASGKNSRYLVWKTYLCYKHTETCGLATRSGDRSMNRIPNDFVDLPYTVNINCSKLDLKTSYSQIY